MTAYQVFLQYFGWPSGAVWSNLIASVIWGVPAAAAVIRNAAKRKTAADATHRIVADLYRRHTGLDHPLAPPGQSPAEPRTLAARGTVTRR